jgi:hypothetical protein
MVVNCYYWSLDTDILILKILCTQIPILWYKKMDVQRYQMFFGHFKVESRVTSVAWATTIPSQNFRFYCFKLVFLIGKVGKIRLKLVLGHLRGLPGAMLRAGFRHHQRKSTNFLMTNFLIPRSSTLRKCVFAGRYLHVFGYPKTERTVSVGFVLKWRARSRKHTVN